MAATTGYVLREAGHYLLFEDSGRISLLMAHIRREIRDYVLAQITGLTTTGSNAFATRIYPMVNAKLPAVICYTNSESSQEVSFSKKRIQNRSLQLIVEGYTKTLNTFDDVLDDIAEEVEIALLDDTTFAGKAINVELTNTEATYSGDGEQPVGTIRLTFEVQYRTETGVPGTAV